MKNKLVVLLEIFIIIGVMLFYMIKVMIPEYRESQGSSDSFVRSSYVINMIEICIDDTTDFALLLNQKGDIYHIFFFDNSSVALYNKNIESQSLEKGLGMILPILIENNLLHEGSKVEILRAKDDYYTSFQTSWSDLIRKYSITIETSEKVQGIDEKAMELGIDTSSFASMILDLDFYSKEIIKDAKKETVVLNKDTSLRFANTVYKKIEDMAREKNISSLKKEEVEIPLSMIPADTNQDYYPTNRSWYYIEDGKVYAFIEFQKDLVSYSYCYRGSIDEKVEGEC